MQFNHLIKKNQSFVRHRKPIKSYLSQDWVPVWLYHLRGHNSQSLLLYAQGPLSTKRVNQGKAVQFLISKNNNKTEGLSSCLLAFPSAGLSEANKEDKPQSCAIPTHELCCFGPMQVSFIFPGFEETSDFLLDELRSSPNASRLRLQAQSTLEVTCGFIWTNTLKQTPWLSFRIA